MNIKLNKLQIINLLLLYITIACNTDKTNRMKVKIFKKNFIIQNIGEKQIILSTLDKLILSDTLSEEKTNTSKPEYINGNRNQEYMIYGETIEVYKKFHMKDGVISCFNLNPTDRDSKIILNGQNGISHDKIKNINNKKGRNGEDGENGGNINLFIQNIPINENPEFISIETKGGNGGNGQDSEYNNREGGDGGNGGNGGNINIFMIDNFKTIYQKLHKYKNEKNSQNEQTLQEIAKTLNNAEIIKLLEQAQELRSNNKQKKFEKKIEKSLELIKYYKEDFLKLFRQNTDTSGGSGGNLGNGTKNGKQGKEGEKGIRDKIYCESSVEELIKKGTNNMFLFCHPIQCQMMLDKAKRMFASINHLPISQDEEKNSDENDTSTVTIILNRLIEKTNIFVNLKKDSDLYKYYSKHEHEIGCIDSVKRLASINFKAKAERKKILENVNFIGIKHNYVPVLSFENCLKNLEKRIKDFKELEKSNTNFYKKFDEYMSNKSQQKKQLNEFEKKLILSKNKEKN